MGDTEYPKRASLEGLVGEIFKLVSRGATPEQWAEWLRVPLEHAAADGNIDLFNALIGAGADGRAGWRGCDGRTLFDAAARGGSAEVVSGLVAAGAQPDDVDVVSALYGRSALYLATSLGHEDAARRLVEAGANVHFREHIRGYDVLIEAAERGLEELVNDLLDGGADPDTRAEDDFGETPLHMAAKSGFDGIVSTLLVRGANVDALDVYGRSPLMKATTAGHLAVVNSLLAAGADAEIRDKEPATALEQATEMGHVEILEAILGHGVDVNAADEDGYTALHCAAVGNQAGATDALVEAGADIELKDKHGWTPLCSAADNTRCTAMRALLHHGANARVRANDGDTVLHIACRHYASDLSTALDLLLRTGADETTVNNDGTTPADMLKSRSSWGRRCSPEELERAQLILARAPNDRAWRRRCWLVMLASRASTCRARTAGSDNRGDSGCGTNAADGGGESGDSMMANIEHAGEDESGVGVQAGSENYVVETGGEGAGLSSLVASLIGLELEGVFRTVVGFL